MHTDHIDDLLEGYALQALETSDQARVEAHVQVCPECRQQARVVQQTVQYLAWSATPAAPPLRCKRKVMERVARDQFLAAPTRKRSTWAVSPVWTGAIAATLMMVVLSVLTLNSQNELRAVRAELASMQTQEAQSVAINQQLVNVAGVLTLNPGSAAPSAKAKCLMQNDNQHCMLIVSDLPPLQAGETYQVWVANDQHQQPLQAFDQTHAQLVVAPPEPMSNYKAMMITIEKARGATVPRGPTVLAADLVSDDN